MIRKTNNGHYTKKIRINRTPKKRFNVLRVLTSYSITVAEEKTTPHHYEFVLESRSKKEIKDFMRDMKATFKNSSI